ncbi:BPI-like_protein [Hexamita inflata]|uniref:BPI-like protein n=1 Tax=Hexamita inflata TaxID=28002 RepID=A0AA86NA96_9EUKA|nr:BPI-like protein [Hexamita inflata]
MFISIIFHSLQSQCDLPNYPQVLIEEDSTLLLSMNNKGMQQFLKCAVQQSPKLLEKLNRSSLSLNVTIDGILIDFDFQNISLVQINTNETVINMKSKSIETHNTNILFNFTWKLQQLYYPYVTDNGIGYINITESDLLVNGLDFQLNIICKGNMNCLASNILFKPNGLDVKLSGSQSQLFVFIEKQLVLQLNQYLQQAMPQLMTDIIFDYMILLSDNQKNYQEYSKYPNILKDDRFVSNMLVELNQLVFMKSGYTFSLDNLSDQFINSQMISTLPVTKNNKQVEYTISKAALDNFLYIFHTYNDSYSNPSVFSVVEAPTMELSKNLVTLNLKVKIQDEEADLKLKGAPKLRTENDLTFLYFEFELEPEYYEVISWVNEQIKDACYLIKNEVFSLNGFSAVIDADNDCVKIVGDIAACL